MMDKLTNFIENGVKAIDGMVKNIDDTVKKTDAVLGSTNPNLFSETKPTALSISQSDIARKGIVKKPLGFTSRGVDEEKLLSIMQALHIEADIKDKIASDPKGADKLTKQLDKVREIRKKMMRRWAGDKVDPEKWYQLKQTLLREFGLRKSLANAIMQKPGGVEDLSKRLEETIELRDRLAKEFKSGGEKDITKCLEC